MNDYFEIEKKVSEATEKFRSAFCAVKSATVIKTQTNRFALTAKYPLAISACVLFLALIVALQILFGLYDIVYFMSEVIIFGAVVYSVIGLSVSFKRTRQNARCCEKIEYRADGGKCLYTEIADGGRKVEYEEARFYFAPDGKVELFEGNGKEYSPFVYKKVRGHSRGYVFLNVDAIIKTFFEGAEVLEQNDGYCAMSSGFRFWTEQGALKKIEVDGLYSECYENDFPLYASLPVSPSYTFTYEFCDVNARGTLILPDLLRDACKYYFAPLPNVRGVIIEELKRN